MIKTFEQFVSDKYGKHIEESLVGAAVSSSIMMSKSRSSRSSSYGADDDDNKNHSKGAKIINAIIKMIFSVGGVILTSVSGIIGLVGIVILCVGVFGGFKDFVDKKILKNNINESLNNDELELITEGKLKDFFNEKILKVAMQNEKVKAICQEIMERDDFKEAQKENSIKELIKCVVNYFKENDKKEKEFKQIQSELKED